MSTIPTTTNETVWKLYQFLGIHENPDGDTKLKMGEASVCRNWKVTRDRNLKRRPGFHTLMTLGESGDQAVRGLWFGNVQGNEIGLAAANGKLWKIHESGAYVYTPVEIGTLDTSRRVTFFPFNNIVYILNGLEYYYYDGAVFDTVEGYVPLVIVSRAPTGADGQTLEEVNKLTGKRRVWFSPDGTSTVFYLPETGLFSIDDVIDNATGTSMPSGNYTTDPANGTVTFTTAPVRGTNTIEISYTFPLNYRNDVTNMTNAELFLGAQDNAVFLYGDGTNKAIYSSVDYNGRPSAEYFPDLNVVTVADDNTPITGMIRHNSTLMCYKTTSTYSISFGMITLADGTQKYGFYVVPANKIIGNTPMGQVRLVLNAPFTLFNSDLYKWENASPYSSEITRDERMAVRVSDRIYSTLADFDFEECYCYDDNFDQEYYIWDHGKALVWNYAADAWYTYTSPRGLEVCSMCNVYDDLIFGMEDGTIRILSELYYNDDGEAIDSYWESGSIDFGKPYQRKFMANLWIGIKPQASSEVTVTIATDKKSSYTERVVDNSFLDFWHVNFAEFSFLMNRKPQIKKLKIKAKKFAFLKLILKTQELDSTATVLMIDPKIRETGYVK